MRFLNSRDWYENKDMNYRVLSIPTKRTLPFVYKIVSEFSAIN